MSMVLADLGGILDGDGDSGAVLGKARGKPLGVIPMAHGVLADGVRLGGIERLGGIN